MIASEKLSIVSLKEQVEDDIRQYLHQLPRQPEKLYRPIAYILSLSAKRTRPICLLIAHHLFGGNSKSVLQACRAVEVFHNFTLVHDDIMDAAPLRRGKETVHTKWGTNAAILSGDAMLVLANEELRKVDAPQKEEVIRLFNETALQVCEGQQLDIDFEKLERVSEEEYLQMIEEKTAVLLACSFKIGALLAGAATNDANNIYEFGRLLGLCFQVKDDYLDAFGDGARVGKKIGGDIISNKKTYLLVKAMELAQGTHYAEEIDTCLRNDKDLDDKGKVEKMLSLYEALDIKAITEQKKSELFDASMKSLEKCAIAEDKRAVVDEFIESLKVRTS